MRVIEPNLTSKAKLQAIDDQITEFELKLIGLPDKRRTFAQQDQARRCEEKLEDLRQERANIIAQQEQARRCE